MPSTTSDARQLDLDELPQGVHDAIRDQLESILQSPEFRRSERMRSLLAHIVSETLVGRLERLKGYWIAVNVFGRGPDFDSQTDTLVRINAGRLRQALERYYFKEGAADPIGIEIPKGGYSAVFSTRGPRFVAEAEPLEDSSRSDLLDGPAVVILPFENLSNDRSEEFFATGLSVEVNSSLAKFQEIPVMGPQTGAFIRSHSGDRVQLAKQIGARFMLDGTVHRTEGQVRIAVSLTDTQNAMQVWAETFTQRGRPEDLLRVERDISARVAARIGDSFGHIPRQLARESRKRDTQRPEAFEAILRFNHHQLEWTAAGHLATMEALQQAARLDPDDAVVLAYLSEHLQDDTNLMLFSVEDAVSQSWELARKSVHLEPRLQRSHFAKAYSHLHRREIDLFFEHADIAMDLNPNAAYLIGLLGWAIALAGDWDRGLAILKRGMDLNPHYPTWFHHAPCLYHLQRGELEKALSQARAFIMPGMQWDPLHRASLHGQLGNTTQARRALSELLALDSDFASHARQFIRGFVFLDDLVEKLLDGLQKAGLQV